MFWHILLTLGWSRWNFVYVVGPSLLRSTRTRLYAVQKMGLCILVCVVHHTRTYMDEQFWWGGINGISLCGGATSLIRKTLTRSVPTAALYFVLVLPGSTNSCGFVCIRHSVLYYVSAPNMFSAQGFRCKRYTSTSNYYILVVQAFVQYYIPHTNQDYGLCIEFERFLWLAGVEIWPLGINGLFLTPVKNPIYLLLN